MDANNDLACERLAEKLNEVGGEREARRRDFHHQTEGLSAESCISAMLNGQTVTYRLTRLGGAFEKLVTLGQIDSVPPVASTNN